MANDNILCVDDDYQFTWLLSKSNLLEQTRGYRLEDIGEVVLSGGIPVAWVPPPDKYSHQSRGVFKLSGEFYTLATADCRDVPGYERLITYFGSNDQDIDRYYQQYGRKEEWETEDK